MPFQVVSYGKYGYKWAKWVTRIELSSIPISAAIGKATDIITTPLLPAPLVNKTWILENN